MSSYALTFAVRTAVTATSLAFTLAAHRALFREATTSQGRTARQRAGLVLGAIAIAAVAFSYVGPLVDALPRVFPFGLFGGLALAVGSLFLPSVRGGFDRLRDGDVRYLVGTRVAFGTMLLAGAAVGNVPESFALSGGAGDILVGCAAIAVPGSLGREGSRGWRALVHGLGIADMIMVVGEVALVVRPWSLEHPGALTTMTLPWLAVPLMVALDLHGLRKVLASRSITEPLGHGSEPPRDVRRAVSGA